MKWCISSISQKLQFSERILDILHLRFWNDLTWNLKCPHWLFISSRTQVLVTRVSPVASESKKELGKSYSHYSQLTRGSSHLDTEVGGKLSQVSLLRNLTVLGVADVDRGHGVLGDKKLEVTWKTEFQKEIFCLLRHLTRWIWIISRCAEVTVNGITT